MKFCNAHTIRAISKATAICCTAICALFLSSCQTPAKKKVAEIRAEERLLSDVQYTIVEEKFGPDIKCVAVGKIELSDDSEDFSELDKVEVVRRTLVGNLFQRNFTQVPLATVDSHLNETANTKTLLNQTACDALLSGQIYRFSNKSFIAASSTEVGQTLLLLILRGGHMEWLHLATSRDGSLLFLHCHFYQGFS